VLANQWRRRRPDPVALPLLDPDALVRDPDATEADSVSAVVDLRAALATLGDADQEILRLIGWEQLTIAEAALVLECGRSAAAVRLHRARRRLAAAMLTTAPASVSSPTVARS
jgi:DNA-directed RNA polymerase specialized sigma24 family protein